MINRKQRREIHLRALEDQNVAASQVRPELAGSLSDHWRRLAESWLAVTDNMPSDDDCRVRALIRAEAFTDCANQLDAVRNIANATNQAEA